ncbi:phosphatase PAP2 family protein [Paracoccus subflavus]|nr:phosphatase PAP2 family protein [Paracoccus subflavus]
MAAALMQCRDAIVGTEIVRPGTSQDVTLGQDKRLERMGRQYRHQALIAELMEDIGFDCAEYDPVKPTAKAFTVLRRKAGGSATSVDYTPLAELVRPGIGDFHDAAPMVATYAELRADRAAEILVQVRDLIPFFVSILPVTPVRCPAVTEMLECALDIVAPVVMRVKIALGCPRPSQFSDRIQPMIAEPPHPSFPSGHATQVFTLATMLSLLDKPGTAVVSDSQVYRLACRIAINRTVAGMHYPVDSAAGAILGIQLGRYLMARGKADGKVGSAGFDGTKFRTDGKPRDFHYAVLDKMMKDDDEATKIPQGESNVRPAPLWQSLCKRGAEEWDSRWS